MSFTTDVIEELMEQRPGKTCCRKAMVCGLFYGAAAGDNRIISAEFSSEEIADRAATILSTQFSAAPERFTTARAGRRLYGVRARTKTLTLFLQSVDNGENNAPISELVGFRCEECSRAFLQGVFTAVGHINDPKKSYHLEFSLPVRKRAERLAEFLDSEVGETRLVDRSGKTGVYYKRNMLITDLLYYLGVMRIAFVYSDICIENDIRNRENRATNCVASNIMRSVSASQKHIDAIEELTRTGRLFKLPEEIRYTASLRMENPSATLSELARLHEPPISKSGLNRRLTRILEELEQ